jgi:DNA-binding transcriptional ArsR family regulator
MCEFVNVAKALADANRVRMLPTLRGRELCACQIAELFEPAPSTMSKHLSILYVLQEALRFATEQREPATEPTKPHSIDQ